MITCGWLVENLQSREGWDAVRSYRIVFFAYAVLGLVKFFLTFFLSKGCEVEKEDQDTAGPASSSETSPLLANDAGYRKQKAKKSLLPSISKESIVIVTNLCLLFAVDSIASGLVPS